ncbi:MAG: alpha/beta fold hydrolase [Vitreoscilla sp.]|nr:alpha/beta fold hydrolase [Burkholderiales bacterium]MBP6338062.1 alpha/beta fold hydrolase [Vitreoscilla sp.]
MSAPVSLARMQQLTTGIWLLGLLSWVGWWTAHGQMAVASVGALAWITGHALWLGITFLMAWAVGRHDPAPKATAGQRLAAWWSEVRCAPRVFFWRQPFRANAFPDALPAEAQGRIGLLLVHGFVCNRGLWNPWLRRFTMQGVPVSAVSLEPVFGSIEDYVAQVEAAVLRLELATGEKPLLVGHSMGGLAIRAWMRAHNGVARVRGVVTVGTPHHGTWLGQWSFSANGQQMRLGSDWLAQLAASETASSRRLFLCCYSHCDNIVFPASSACLTGAQVCHVPATAHIDLIHHPRVMAEVLACLDRRQAGLNACAPVPA